MTPADLAALERGCCTRKKAAESGCPLCVERYAAIDRVFEELQREKQRADEAELAVETWLATEREIISDAQRRWLFSALNIAWRHGYGYALGKGEKSGDMINILSQCERELGPLP